MSALAAPTSLVFLLNSAIHAFTLPSCHCSAESGRQGGSHHEAYPALHLLENSNLALVDHSWPELQQYTATRLPAPYLEITQFDAVCRTQGMGR